MAGSPPEMRNRETWLLDHLALWAERVGDVLAGPFYRLSRWATGRWWERQP